MTRITILVDNSVHQPGLAAEHGFSVHVERPGRNLLFDTGQTGLLTANAAALGVRLDSLDAIVLSHGHYDHTGGLGRVLELAPGAKLFAHPQAAAAKYSRGNDGTGRFIGMSEETRQQLARHPAGWARISTPTDLGDGIFVTGEVPRANEFEDVGGAFFQDAACAHPDTLVDDQALVVDLGASLLVILGCAHAGVVNTLAHVQACRGGKPVRVVLGGMHLAKASERRLAETVLYLRQLGLELLVPAHCTGWPATARLWQAFPSICRPAGVGARFEFAD